MIALWIEEVVDGRVLLHHGADAHELHGLAGRRVLAWHRSLCRRDSAGATLYLQGVVDGLASAGDDGPRLRVALRVAQANLAAGTYSEAARDIIDAAISSGAG